MRELPVLQIGLFAEGSTDLRLLGPIIQKTFVEVQSAPLEAAVVVLAPIEIKGVGASYSEKLHDAARRAAVQGVQILCVQLDADDRKPKQVKDRKLDPALAHLRAQPATSLCGNICPLVPVQAMEAWMLADLDLLRRAIDTSLTVQELKLTRLPEAYARPKDDLEAAIRLAQQEGNQRRRLRGRGTTIANLYGPVGELLGLHKLKPLPSYRAFRTAAEAALEQLGYLR